MHVHNQSEQKLSVLIDSTKKKMTTLSQDLK